MQMGLIARRDLEDAGLDLDKSLFVEKAPRRFGDRCPRQQERLAIGVPGTMETAGPSQPSAAVPNDRQPSGPRRTYQIPQEIGIYH
jgi:hypothetical protein